MENNNTEQKYTLKIDGIEAEYTLDEIKRMAEKAGGADRKFMDAAAQRKENARIKELSAKALDSQLDESEFMELGRLMGFPEDHIKRTWAVSQDMQTDEEDDPMIEDPRVPGAEANPNGASMFRELQEQNKKLAAQLETLQQNFLKLETHTIEGVQKNIAGDLEKRVAAHPKFGKMSEKQRQLLIDNIVRPELARKVQAGEPYGPVTLDKVLEQAQAVSQGLGLISSDQQDADEKATQLSNLIGAGGYGGTNSIVTAVKEGKPLIRPKATDGNNYADYIGARMLQEHSGKAQESQPLSR